MIVYDNYKDKDGTPVQIKFYTAQYWAEDEFIKCVISIEKKKTIKRWFKKNEEIDYWSQVWSSNKDLGECDDFTCDNFKLWGERTLDYYNKDLIKEEKKKATLELIENGCSKED